MNTAKLLAIVRQIKLRAIVGQILRRLPGRRDRVWEPSPRPPKRRTPVIAVPFACPVPERDELSRRAVVAHLFHDDMGPAFRRYFANISGAVDLFLSTDTEAKEAVLAETFAGWPAGNVTIRTVPNVGRDIAPKFVTFADVYSRYDAVLFVHSKKSVYLRDGVEWRTLLLETLCGSPATVRSILHLLGDTSGVGLVFPDHYMGIADRLSWGGNRAEAGRIAARAGIALDRATMLEFVSGSMFWARPAALAPLLSLGWLYDDFPEECGQLDATPAHALERLLLYSTEAAGLAWLRIADPRFAPARMLTIGALGDVPSAIARSRVRMLPVSA